MSETDCQQVLRLLEAYCDRELSSGEAEAVEHHLFECMPCLDRRDFRVRLREIIRTRCGAAPQVPTELAERVRARLRSA